MKQLKRLQNHQLQTEAAAESTQSTESTTSERYSSNNQYKSILASEAAAKEEICANVESKR